MLQFDVPGSLFVDFFAGSGGIGIEALSRGAEKAFFVDHSRDAISCVTGNLARCHLEDRAVVLRMEAVSAIPQIAHAVKEEESVIYFLDPPYDRETEYGLLEALCARDMIRPCDLVVLETSLSKETISELPVFLKNCELEILKEKRYKNQRHVFIRKESRNS